MSSAWYAPHSQPPASAMHRPGQFQPPHGHGPPRVPPRGPTFRRMPLRAPGPAPPAPPHAYASRGPAPGPSQGPPMARSQGPPPPHHPRFVQAPVPTRPMPPPTTTGPPRTVYAMQAPAPPPSHHGSPPSSMGRMMHHPHQHPSQQAHAAAAEHPPHPHHVRAGPPPAHSRVPPPPPLMRRVTMPPPPYRRTNEAPPRRPAFAPAPPPPASFCPPTETEEMVRQKQVYEQQQAAYEQHHAYEQQQAYEQQHQAYEQQQVSYEHHPQIPASYEHPPHMPPLELPRRVSNDQIPPARDTPQTMPLMPVISKEEASPLRPIRRAPGNSANLRVQQDAASILLGLAASIQKTPSDDSSTVTSAASHKDAGPPREPRKFPTRLATPGDEAKLNSMHCFLRSELLEVFVVERSKSPLPGDARQSDTPTLSNEQQQAAYCRPVSPEPSCSGRVGLRCVHCAMARKRFGGLECEAPMAVFYPKTVSEIYRLVTSWQRVHLRKCRNLPEKVREEYQKLKETDKTRGKTRFWVTSADDIGLVDCPSRAGGVVFCP